MIMWSLGLVISDFYPLLSSGSSNSLCLDAKDGENPDHSESFMKLRRSAVIRQDDEKVA
jgi:hypothetical protein